MTTFDKICCHQVNMVQTSDVTLVNMVKTSDVTQVNMVQTTDVTQVNMVHTSDVTQVNMVQTSYDPSSTSQMLASKLLPTTYCNTLLPT